EISAGEAGLGEHFGVVRRPDEIGLPSHRRAQTVPVAERHPDGQEDRDHEEDPEDEDRRQREEPPVGALVPAESAGTRASQDRHPALAASSAACRLACRVVRIVWASPPVANPSSEALKSAMTSAAPAKAIGLTA